MPDKTIVQGPSIGFAGLLTLVFITLKLCKVINWSWWWVTSPLWISFGIVISIFIILVFIGVIVAMMKR